MCPANGQLNSCLVAQNRRMRRRQQVFLFVVSCTCRRNPLTCVYNRPSRIGPHFAHHFSVQFLFHTVHFLKQPRRFLLVMDYIRIIRGNTAGYRIRFSARAVVDGGAAKQTQYQPLTFFFQIQSLIFYIKCFK